MKINIFCATYSDFVKFNKKPNEDFYLVSEKFPIFVLADGVTQSSFLSGEYSYPEGARTAAKIFCYETLSCMEENFKKREDEILFKESFKKANKKIKELNETEGMAKKLDYLVFDYFDAVGIAGFLKKDILHYGFVGDCGLIVFDKNNEIKFQTEDQVEPAMINARDKYKNWKELDKRQRTIIMHKEFRNLKGGSGYGSFSGEDGIEDYYITGKTKLSAGDLAVFYSDGFLPYFQFIEFIDILRKQNQNILDSFVVKKAEENPEELGCDRTLISFNFNR
ncbi:MAG: hypothetical protein HYT36_02300 [Candidatus Staskawiczbacteria bacterium]|nr:hypothetical protein [Candidatus Staskawiczbacteria bacterium]